MLTFHHITSAGTLIDGKIRITKSCSFTLPFDGDGGCTIVSALSCYRGSAPQITFDLFVGEQSDPLYRSPIYSVGGDGTFIRQQWRVPPMFLPTMRTVITLTIPENSSLTVAGFSAEHSHALPDWHGGLRHNAHLGFYGMAPDNTMPAFELAAQCGFSSCIVVPKLTKDGQLVCIHDDTINRTARDKNGNPPAEEITVWDKTYEELSVWDYGVYKNEIYRGTKIPLLSDFFALCARTGMRPMFSTHPGLPEEKWAEIRDMLTKLGLLHLFHVKSFAVSNLETAFSVLGEGIDGYTIDMNTPSEETVEEFASSPVGRSWCRLGVEWPARHYTKENAAMILERGYFAAAYSVKRITSDRYRELISFGVSEFTEDHHCSMGLNW